MVNTNIVSLKFGLTEYGQQKNGEIARSLGIFSILETAGSTNDMRILAEITHADTRLQYGFYIY